MDVCVGVFAEDNVRHQADYQHRNRTRLTICQSNQRCERLWSTDTLLDWFPLHPPREVHDRPMRERRVQARERERERDVYNQTHFIFFVKISIYE